MSSQIEKQGQWAGLDAETLSLLRNYNSHSGRKSLAELLGDPARFADFSRGIDGMLLDFTRVHFDARALDMMLALADAAGLAGTRARLFEGAHINSTEDRPAMHMALRNRSMLATLAIEGASEAAASMERMFTLAAALHAGRLPAEPEQPVRDIVHIGIGGSLLGTRLLCEALAGIKQDGPRVHFLGSVDAHPRAALLERLNPAETVVVTVSKSFTTADTLMHASKLKGWLESALGPDGARKRMFAVTEKTDRAVTDGFLSEQTLFLPSWVGGRYSLWSPVSLSAAAAIGPDSFAELLEGAAAMDAHFRDAGHGDNLPVLMGLIGIWHRNVCNYSAWGVVPYDQRLRSLPAHLQQLVMESTGKSVTAGGRPVVYGTAPVVFGESGTEAQHSIFQALHQGPDRVPVNMVGIIRPDHDDADAHAELLANMLAQATALATGRSEAETRQQLEQSGGNALELLAHRSFSGNRPTELLLLDRLTPANLGKLLALYEHKVFVESVIWGVNAFDQWGVELGKVLAPDVRAGLQGGQAPNAGLRGVLEYIASKR